MSYWAVVPAAGSGSRMQTSVPKQYLTLAGKTVIEHTLSRLLTHARIDGVVVALAADDERWAALDFPSNKPLLTVAGGSERCTSVLNALAELRNHAQPDDWVLVHDGARPCIRHSDITALITKLHEHPVGGLLGVPVRDTMKRCDPNDDIIQTVERKQLWHAHTPQMFRLGALHDALRDAIDKGVWVTDESAAMELHGHKPRMVQGASDNIKITRPEDLMVAEFYLRQQGRDRVADLELESDGEARRSLSSPADDAGEGELDRPAAGPN
jgi:2-C-methyl-D-erythritol 4-phosphate cytidylyltransferase